MNIKLPKKSTNSMRTIAISNRKTTISSLYLPSWKGKSNLSTAMDRIWYPRIFCRDSSFVNSMWKSPTRKSGLSVSIWATSSKRHAIRMIKFPYCFFATATIIFMELYNGVVRTLGDPKKVQKLVLADNLIDFVSQFIN